VKRCGRQDKMGMDKCVGRMSGMDSSKRFHISRNEDSRIKV
jgi:hypothetical protein